MGKKPKEKLEIICLCNNVSRETIENAIRSGTDTLNGLFDATSAGVGPCGGSCRRKLAPMIDEFKATGKFPEVIKPDMTGKKRKAV